MGAKQFKKEWQDILDEYLTSLKQAGKSRHTLDTYRWNIIRMLGWLENQGCRDLANIGRVDIRQWGASLWDDWRPATVKTAVCAARSFLQWLQREGLLDGDLSSVLKVPTIPQRRQRTLTVAEVLIVIERCCDRSTPKGRRDLAIFITLLDTGLRSGELCTLKITDVDFDRRQARVVGKGNAEGVVYFGHACQRQLRIWLKDRRGIAQPGVETVFISIGGLTPGRPLTPRGLGSILKKMGESAGIKGVSPHALRRTFATLAIQAGAPTRVVQEMGRWASIQQVEVYTRALEVEKQARQYLPGDRLLRFGKGR